MKGTVVMASAQGTFESIVGSYFDDFVAPTHADKNLTEDELLAVRGKYVQETTSSPLRIKKIEDLYGITII
jgi:hypothetical protein